MDCSPAIGLMGAFRKVPCMLQTVSSVDFNLSRFALNIVLPIVFSALGNYVTLQILTWMREFSLLFGTGVVA